MVEQGLYPASICIMKRPARQRVGLFWVAAETDYFPWSVSRNDTAVRLAKVIGALKPGNEGYIYIVVVEKQLFNS